MDIENFLINFNKENQIKQKEKIKRYRIWLNITDICDLSCIYCSSFCDLKGKKVKTMMDFETAKKSIHNALDEFNTKKLKICFFGGEPLLNEKLIYEVVEYCNSLKDYNFTFSISTNALKLNDKIIDFISKNNFDSVQISIDGNYEVQNKQRPIIDSKGKQHYYSIENNIKKLLEKVDNKIITARATFTPYSLELVETFKYLANLGFKKIHFEPNISREKLSLNNKEYLEKLQEQITELVKIFFEYIKSGKIIRMVPLSNYYDILTFNNSLVHNCEAGICRFAYDVDGKRSPCHMVKGAKKDQLEIAIKKRDTVCKDCLYNNICQGLCLGAIYYAENDYKLLCNIQKMYINAMIEYIEKNK